LEQEDQQSSSLKSSSLVSHELSELSQTCCGNVDPRWACDVGEHARQHRYAAHTYAKAIAAAASVPVPSSMQSSEITVSSVFSGTHVPGNCRKMIALMMSPAMFFLQFVPFDLLPIWQI
jgi:hypothetical protein